MFAATTTDDELLAQLKAKYERTPPGDCPVCAARVAVEPHAGGYPLPWVCPDAKKALDAAVAAGAPLEALAPLHEHVRLSRWEDFRQVGDQRVMQLISRFEALKARARSGTTNHGRHVAAEENLS